MTGGSNPRASGGYRVAAVACASRYEADRLRVRASCFLDARAGVRMITVAATRRGHVCTHGSLVNGTGLGITWWVLLIAACFRWADARMIWGVPIALVWQAVEDSGIAIADVERLAGMVEPDGSALYWLEERLTPNRALRSLAAGRKVECLELPASLRDRLGGVAGRHSLVY